MDTITRVLKKSDPMKDFMDGYNITDCIPMDYMKLREDALKPTRGSEEAAGYDLYVPQNENGIGIPAHETKLIDTGIAIELPKGTFGAIFARSGLATKQGLRPANCVGVVDADYRGEVKVALHNDTNEHRVISGGERIAQLVVIPYVNVELFEVDKLSDTERGDGGFGSTGA